ncbi:hypothetical protein M9458_003268, partial [Cirrhinus mrigala]
MRVEITTSVSPPMTSPPSWRSTSETWVGQDVVVEVLVEAVAVVVVVVVVVVAAAAAAAVVVVVVVDGQAEVEADLR